MLFKELTDFLDNIDKNLVPQCEMAVFQDNKQLYFHRSNREDAPFFEEDNLYFIFSATKVITCTAALRLVERGAIQLDDPVSKYLPEFGTLYLENNPNVPAEKTLKVRHLFTMTGGFDYNLSYETVEKVKKEKNGRATTREIVSAMAKMPLLFEPGEGYCYSLCHDILAAVVEVASGKRFGEFLKDEIFDPLGMNETTFRPTAETRKRMRQFAVDSNLHYSFEQEPENGFILSECYESGGAGLISSLSDYCKFADALASSKSPDGYVLLKPETVNLMRSNQLSGASEKEFHKKLNHISKYGYSYGLGVRTMCDPAMSGNCSPVGEFGWDGYAGAYVIIYPEKKLSVIYLQHVVRDVFDYGNGIHNAIKNYIFKDLNNLGE